MGKFYYKCFICNTEAEYNDNDKFCFSCGKKINKNVVAFDRSVAINIAKIAEEENTTSKLKAQYEIDRIEPKMVQYNLYNLIDEMLRKNDAKSEDDLKEITLLLENKIEEIKTKLDKIGVVGKEIFMFDSLFQFQWIEPCKRLFPTDENSGAISAIHTYNAFLCAEKRQNYIGIDILKKLNMINKNGIFVFLGATDQDLSFYSISDDEKEEISLFPLINLVLNGHRKYSLMYDFIYSENNIEKEEKYFIVNKPCIMNNKKTHLELNEKGEVLFLTEEEYKTVRKYYNEIISKIKETANQNITEAEQEINNEIDYYGLLNEMWDKYSVNALESE